jgi:hypothetical protein
MIGRVSLAVLLKAENRFSNILGFDMNGFSVSRGRSVQLEWRKENTRLRFMRSG